MRRATKHTRRAPPSATPSPMASIGWRPQPTIPVTARTYYYPQFDQRISGNPRAAHDGIARGLDDESAAKFFSSLRYGDFNASVYYSDRRKFIPTAAFETIFNDPEQFTDDVRGYVELGYKHALSEQADLQVRGFYDHSTYEGDLSLRLHAHRQSRGSRLIPRRHGRRVGRHGAAADSPANGPLYVRVRWRIPGQPAGVSVVVRRHRTARRVSRSR